MSSLEGFFSKLSLQTDEGSGAVRVEEHPAGLQLLPGSLLLLDVHGRLGLLHIWQLQVALNQKGVLLKP